MNAREPSALRSDAERNRARIIHAARTLLASEGVDVSMALVAREAGVGIATLFRRFPTKEDLVAAVFVDRMTEYTAVAAAGLEDEDPWRGLVRFIERTCELQASDSGFAEILTMSFPEVTELGEQQAAAHRMATKLIRRAKESGQLRQDFTPEDLMLLHMANAGVIAATSNHAPEAWRRVIAQLIQSFRAPALCNLPPAPSPQSLYRAMTDPRRRHWQWHEIRRRSHELASQDHRGPRISGSGRAHHPQTH